MKDFSTTQRYTQSFGKISRCQHFSRALSPNSGGAPITLWHKFADGSNRLDTDITVSHLLDKQIILTDFDQVSISTYNQVLISTVGVFCVNDEVSVTQAAAILSVSRQHVLRLIGNKKLEARKIGNQWVIERQSVETYKAERKAAKK